MILLQFKKGIDLKENVMKYTDQLKKATTKANISFGFNILLLVLLCASMTNNTLISRNYMALDKKIEDAVERGRIILTPIVQGRVNIERGSIVSDGYIKGMAKEVINKLEAWTYESIEDNYSELFREYYDHSLIVKTKADVDSSRLYDTTRQKKMVSLWKMDPEKSEFTWCNAIQRACAIVTGTTKTYIAHNQPYKTEERAYFILAQDIHPNEHKNNYALLVTRLVYGNREELKQLMEAAKSGRLKDV